MTKKQVGHFRKLLEREAREILEKVSDEGTSLDIPDSFNTPDVVDAADLEQLHEATLQKEATEYQRWMDVQAALEKIKEGAYGICESCGREIPEPRLQAYPAAKLCLDCQREYEYRNLAGPATGTRLNRYVEFTSEMDVDWEN